ncbi:MAG: ligand-binding sensor domain-containing protein/two-component sensor histidine kinase [Crocinitomix sp.]|jgi:ligand-binding sensor domain-containing protein/two-component sensor histidine kinase
MKFTIAFLLLSLSLNLFGAESSYRFKKYDVNHGLPSLQAYEILQDPKGYIWIATDRGLVKYDGYEFEVFTVKDGLSTDVIFRLHILPNGRIACYGKDRRIHSFDGDRFRLIQRSLSMIDVVTTYSNLLSFSINNNGFSFSTTDRTPEAIIHLEYSVTEQKLVTNRQDGLHISDNQFGLEIAFKGGSYSDCFFYNGNKFLLSDTPLEVGKFAYVVRSNGVIFFSVSGSLYRFDPALDKQASLLMHFENTILTLKSDSQGNLFVGSRFDGLWEIDTSQPNAKKHLIKNRSISSVLIDANDGIWVTTLYNGIYHCSDRNDRVIVLQDKEEKIQKLKVIDDQMYGLSTKRNLYKLDQFGIEEIAIEMNSVFDIPEKNAYDLIALPVFACIYDYRTKIFNNFKGVGYEFIKDDYACYGLQSSEIIKFTNTNNEHYNMGDFMYGIMDFGRDTMLICTGGGVMKYSKNQVTLDSLKIDLSSDPKYYTISNALPYSPKQSFFKSKVRDMINIGDTLFIFGSAEQGVFIRGLNKKDTWLQMKDGLVSNSIDKVYFDNGRIIVVSNTGISIIEEGRRIKNFTRKNGLLSNFVHDALIYNELLYVATDGGTSIFPLAQNNSIGVPIYLAELKINGQVCDLKTQYELEHYENELDISIDGLSFEQEGDINYKYRLTGVDQHWIESENRTFRYSNLPSGKFFFQIKAEDYNGDWTDSVVLFSINKKIPFWQTGSFYTVIILAFSGVIWFIIWMVYKRKRRFERDKIRILNLERKTLQAQMNPHFMFNSLNSLQNLIIKDKKAEAQEYLGEFARLTRLALIQSTKNSIRLNEEIEILQHYIELEKIRYLDSFQVEISVELSDRNIEISPMLIQPFVENAIIHGLANKKQDGKLQITFSDRSNKTIQCFIEDNGTGRIARNNQKKHKSLGINLVRERLSILLKEEAIRIEDLFANDQPIGTRVVLIIPFKKAKK